jgi:hypothetical protein
MCKARKVLKDSMRFCQGLRKLTLPTNHRWSTCVRVSLPLVHARTKCSVHLVIHRFGMVKITQPCTSLSQVTHNLSRWLSHFGSPPKCLGDVNHYINNHKLSLHAINLKEINRFTLVSLYVLMRPVIKQYSTLKSVTRQILRHNSNGLLYLFKWERALSGAGLVYLMSKRGTI